MKVLGMLSGTSHDGIDSAIVDFTLDEGVLRGTLLHSDNTPYSATLRERLTRVLPPARTTVAELCELDTLIGQSFAAAAQNVTARAGGVDLVVSHGQTVYHWVEDSHAKGTLQIGQPAWIAEHIATPVLSDVRIRDITVGGQGAPLVSYLDSLLLADFDGTAAALNLGGISNITVVRAATDITAYDIGPANALIDAAIVRGGLNQAGYDADGAVAAAGSVDETLLRVLLDEPYYRLPAPKSTGKELFHGGYIDAAIVRAGTQPSPADLVATLTQLTVRTVARDVTAAGISTLVVSGGGSRNPVILRGLRKCLPQVDVMLSDELRVPTDDKEAIAFALLGWCTAHGLPGAVPAGTGARAPRILGTLTPGAGPLTLPTPLTEPPRGLTLGIAAS